MGRIFLAKSSFVLGTKKMSFIDMDVKRVRVRVGGVRVRVIKQVGIKQVCIP